MQRSDVVCDLNCSASRCKFLLLRKSHPPLNPRAGYLYASLER
jgi:hypothetical protein